MSEKLNVFDWHSTSLTVENCKDKFDNLMTVLVLPTVDLFLPILSEVGFPDYLIQHPEIWKSVFSEFKPLYKNVMDEYYEWSSNIACKYRDRIVKVSESDLVYDRNKLHERLRVFYDSHDLIEFHVRLKLWKDVLELLANRAGKSVAIEFERWIYYHYLSDRFNNAIQAWWIVLNDSESVPNCLEPMLDSIVKLNEGGLIIKFMDELDELVIKYYEESNFKPCSEADIYSLKEDSPQYIADSYILQQAWKKNRVMPILQLFARSLDSDQIKTVVEWAEEFYDSNIFSYGTTELCGDELITTKILFSELPSVLDNPNL